jgi:flavin reductase (DIM6/NTAB) family NADH-FMN oxidoreductase RutF
MPTDEQSDLAMLEALGRLPVSRFLLTASHGMSRNGMIISRVHQTADTPPTVILSVPKGQPLSPLIRDSRSFALCELAEGDLLLSRLFNAPRELHGEDPFLGLLLVKNASGLPVPRSVASWIECELIRHLDIEADYEVYVGRAITGGVLEQGRAPTRKRTSHPGTDGRGETLKIKVTTKKTRATKRRPSPSAS